MRDPALGECTYAAGSLLHEAVDCRDELRNALLEHRGLSPYVGTVSRTVLVATISIGFWIEEFLEL